ncbi:MAG: hypothetical protein RLZZ15_2776 [Verrucomicrobiota bacterium]|jgi:colicin import membrane protein
MKKSYLYFIVPLVGVAVFFGFYLKASKEYEAIEANQAAKVRKEKEEKLRKEQADRSKAVQDALAAQEVRKVERKKKQDQEEKEKEERERAVQARNRAGRDADKVEAQVKRLDKEIAAEKVELAKIEEEKKRLGSETAFLKEYVKAAEANTLSYSAVLDKIDAADKEWERFSRDFAKLQQSLAPKKP